MHAVGKLKKKNALIMTGLAETVVFSVFGYVARAETPADGPLYVWPIRDEKPSRHQPSKHTHRSPPAVRDQLKPERLERVRGCPDKFGVRRFAMRKVFFFSL